MNRVQPAAVSVHANAMSGKTFNDWRTCVSSRQSGASAEIGSARGVLFLTPGRRRMLVPPICYM
ncbi:hypothetical protein GCM10023168_10040 [Fodinibacter luteus]|uniref:Uncharacterized protein n=1 Tax=Fodinibacter luteus TaxID=552064 RepID=A0ABP8K5Y5_9MICO